MTASDRASGKLRSAESAGDDVAESMGQAERRARGLRKGFMASAAAAAVVSGALVGLTRQHGRTEQTMARLATVSGATDEEMSKIRDTAMAIGRELPVAMGDAANAMEQLAFAGFEAEEAIDAARGVADLATASNMNMAQSARSTASALRMFGLEADQTVQVTSAMAATFSNSATTITELSSALEYVGATATSAGVSLQEMSAAIGVLADRGIRASKAGTALNTTLQRIVSGSGKAESALNRLNLSFEDLTNAEGEVAQLGTVLSTISNRMDTLESDAERMQVATELAGRRGARALLPLIESTEDLNEKMGDIFRSEIRASIGELARLSQDEIGAVEEALGGMEIDREDVTPKDVIQGLEDMRESGVGVDEMATRLQASLGISSRAATSLAEDVHDSSVSADELAESIGGATTASEIAASQMDTTAGAIQFMKSSFDAMTFTIFTGAAPAIEWFNQKLAAGINVLNENEAAMKAVGTALAGLAGILGVAAAAFGAAWVQASVIPAVMGVVQGSFLAGAASATTLTGALSALVAPLAAVAAPALAIVAAVGILVAAFFTLREVISQDILGVGSDLAVLMERIGAVVDFLKPTVEPLIGIFVELGKILLAVAAAPLVLQIMAIIKGLKLLSDIVVWTVDAIMGLVNGTKTLEGVLGDAASNIVSFFSGIGSTIVAAVTSIDWAGIASSIAGAVAGLAGTAVDAIAGIDWGAVGMTIIRGIAFGIGAGVGLFLKALAAYGKALVWFWTTVPGLFLDAVTAIPGLIADGIVAGVGLLVDGLVAYGEALVWFWTTVPGMFLDAVTAIPGMLVDAIVAGVGLWLEGWRMYTDFLVSFWSGAADLLVDVGGNIVEGLKNGLISAAPNVAAGIRKVVGIIRDFLPFSNAKRGPLSSIMSVGGKIVGAITGGLKGAVGLAKNAAAAVAGAISGAFDSLVGGAASIGKKIGGALADGLKGAKDKAVGAAKAVGGAVSGAASTAVDSAIGGASKLKDSGAALVDTVASGAESASSSVKDAVGSAADKAGSLLPMSNADEGPFSNLVERGQKLVSTVAKGVEGEDSTLQDTLAGVAEGTPFGQAASSLVGAIGGAGGPAAGAGGKPAKGGSRPIEIVLEQTNNFDGAGDREEIRRMVREATRSGGEDALAELELLLKQTLSEA